MVARPIAADLQGMGKVELREECRNRGISYSKLTVAAMREAVLAHDEAKALSNEPDAVLAPASPRINISCSDVAASLVVGEPYDLKELADRHRLRVDSLRTVLSDHNNEKHAYSKRGLRFTIAKGSVTRTA